MSPSVTADFPTADEIAAIADVSDPALRNLRITWAYYRLNRAMTAVTGERDLTWCGFAVWASKTAGTFIRDQEVPSRIERWIEGAKTRGGLLPRLVENVFSVRPFLREVLGGVSGDIATGNQEVFRHITPPFANFLSLWTAREGQLSEGDRAPFLATLRDDANPQQSDFLTEAFSATFDAVLTSDPRRRSQAMLQANGLIGCAEQTRVQPYIVQSMNCPIVDLLHQHLDRHSHSLFGKAAEALVHALVGDFARGLEDEFQDLSTEWMMRLDLPGEALHLGADVPCLTDGRMYPPLLASLDAPQPMQLFEQLHAIDDKGCAARDWASYADRMRYIAVLFRSRQQEKQLWTTPFTDAQVSELDAGRVPDGAL